MKIDVSLSVHDTGAKVFAFRFSLAVMAFSVLFVGPPELLFALGSVFCVHVVTASILSVSHPKYGFILVAGVGMISCPLVGALVAWLTPHCDWQDGAIVGAVYNLIASVILWDLRSKLPWND